MNKIFIGGPSPQEAQGWTATNSTALTTHIASIEIIIKTNNIPPSHITNLDETGGTLNRDTRGKRTGEVAMRRSMRAMGDKNQMRSAHFKNVSRVTMMPVVFADDGCGRSLFVVQGRTLSYRIVYVNGVRATQSFTDCLPKGSYIKTREDVVVQLCERVGATVTVQRYSKPCWHTHTCGSAPPAGIVAHELHVVQPLAGIVATGTRVASER